jgi:hypothetical protein
MPKAGDRAKERRLIRLLSAGWLPHDQGSSRGFLASSERAWAVEFAMSASATPASNLRMRGFPTLSCPDARFGHRWCKRRQVSSACVVDVDVDDQAALTTSLTTAFGSTSRAMAQIKPTSSRATATIAFGAGLPAATSLR